MLAVISRSWIFGPSRSAMMASAWPDALATSPQPVIDDLVVGVVAVREVHPGHVYPRNEQGGDHLR